ncbi:hypothetical protein KOXY103107_07295 [Komagataeibacter xylinus]
MFQPPWQVGIGNKRTPEAYEIRPPCPQRLFSARLRVTTGINHCSAVDDAQGFPERYGYVGRIRT